MDTRLIIWWNGIAEPAGASQLSVDFNRLKFRFSVLAGYSDASAPSALGSALRHHLHCDLPCTCVKVRVAGKTR